MDESRDNPRTSKSAERKRAEYTGLGVVFALMGVALLLTLDTPAVGLPMIVLGVVFFAMGLRVKRSPSSGDEQPRS